MHGWIVHSQVNNLYLVNQNLRNLITINYLRCRLCKYDIPNSHPLKRWSSSLTSVSNQSQNDVHLSLSTFQHRNTYGPGYGYPPSLRRRSICRKMARKRAIIKKNERRGYLVPSLSTASLRVEFSRSFQGSLRHPSSYQTLPSASDSE